MSVTRLSASYAYAVACPFASVCVSRLPATSYVLVVVPVSRRDLLIEVSEAVDCVTGHKVAGIANRDERVEAVVAVLRDAELNPGLGHLP